MEAAVHAVHTILKADNPTLAPTKARIRALLADPKAEVELQNGNEKLGSRIRVWGLPAGCTCPGKTGTCAGKCYAKKNFYVYPSVVRNRHRNFVLANRPDFADLLGAAVQGSKIIRVHDSGDFFSAAYTEAWRAVMAANPDTKFFVFSRSWRVEGVASILTRMAGLKNARVWYSVDRETGWPGSIPKRVRLAYMQVAADDEPSRQVDLVFRDGSVRLRKVAKRVAGALVCPYENGVTRKSAANNPRSDFSCSSCGLCWDSLGGPKDPRAHHGAEVSGTGRTPLRLLPISV